MVALGSGAFYVNGDVTNNGTIRLTGGAAINVSGTFINYGLLDMMTGTQTLPAGFENHGTVLDSGLIRADAVSKSGQSFTVTIKGYAGHGYQLQRADTVTWPWITVGSDQPGIGAMLPFTDNGGATGAQKFYRISVAP